MQMIKGTDVILFDKVKVGKDALNNTIYEEHGEKVENVLIYPNGSDDVTTSTNIVGKQITFTLGIPKKDTHEWENKHVQFMLGGRLYNCMTYGFVIQGIESNVPTKWHKKVLCEAYE